MGLTSHTQLELEIHHCTVYMYMSWLDAYIQSWVGEKRCKQRIAIKRAEFPSTIFWGTECPCASVFTYYVCMYVYVYIYNFYTFMYIYKYISQGVYIYVHYIYVYIKIHMYLIRIHRPQAAPSVPCVASAPSHLPPQRTWRHLTHLPGQGGVKSYLSIYVSMYLCIYLCIYVSIYVSMYLCIYVCIYICTGICRYLSGYLYS